MIRLLTPDDFPLWKSIRLEAVRNAPYAFGGSYEEESVQTEKEWENSLRTAHIFAYMHEGKAVAIAGYYFSAASKLRHRAKVFSVYVTPEFRGKGTMGAVLEALIHHARAQGMEQLHLDVGVHNLPAIACYKRHGFARYGMEPRALKLDDGYIDEYLMVKYL